MDRRWVGKRVELGDGHGVLESAVRALHEYLLRGLRDEVGGCLGETGAETDPSHSTINQCGDPGRRGGGLNVEWNTNAISEVLHRRRVDDPWDEQAIRSRSCVGLGALHGFADSGVEVSADAGEEGVGAGVDEQWDADLVGGPSDLGDSLPLLRDRSQPVAAAVLDVDTYGPCPDDGTDGRREFVEVVGVAAIDVRRDGTCTAATIRLTASTAAARGRWSPSGYPRDQAMPALVLAMASASTASMSRADAASHALGSTSAGGSCMARNARARASWVGSGGVPDAVGLSIGRPLVSDFAAPRPETKEGCEGRPHPRVRLADASEGGVRPGPIDKGSPIGPIPDAGS